MVSPQQYVMGIRTFHLNKKEQKCTDIFINNQVNTNLKLLMFRIFVSFVLLGISGRENTDRTAYILEFCTLLFVLLVFLPFVAKLCGAALE